MVDDCVITTGGVDIVTKDRFKAWVKQFLDKVADLEFGVVRHFRMRTEAGLRRAGGSRAKTMGYWACPQISGRDRLHRHCGWAVREDGKLLHNWVERSSWELFQRLDAK